MALKTPYHGTGRAVTALLILILFCGCSTYELHELRRGNENEWVVQKGKMDYPLFTIDDNKRFPRNKDVAEKRFARRRAFVEEYYGSQNRGNPALTALFLLTAPLGPVLFVAVGEMYGPFGKLSPEDIQKKEVEANKIREFLADDMAREMMETTVPKSLADPAIHPSK
jgi:hypothetical protein